MIRRYQLTFLAHLEERDEIQFKLTLLVRRALAPWRDQLVIN